MARTTAATLEQTFYMLICLFRHIGTLGGWQERERQKDRQPTWHRNLSRALRRSSRPRQSAIVSCSVCKPTRWTIACQLLYKRAMKRRQTGERKSTRRNVLIHMPPKLTNKNKLVCLLTRPLSSSCLSSSTDREG